MLLPIGGLPVAGCGLEAWPVVALLAGNSLIHPANIG